MRKTLWILMCISLSFRLTAGPSDDELLLADGLYARGFYEMALREYERVLEAHPEFENRNAVLFRAAESARRLDRPATARALYQEVLRRDGSGPFAARSLLRLADMAFDENDFAVAGEHAKGLLRLHPAPEHAAAALHTLADVAREMGDLDEARDYRIRLVRDYPEDPHSAYAAILLAEMVPRGQYEERRKWYKAALIRPPSPDLEVEALWGLGVLELDAGEIPSAAERFDRLWRSHPDHPRVQTGSLTIAWALMMAEQDEDALRVSLQTPARRKAEQPDSWIYLEAVSFRNTRNDEEAYLRFRRLMDEFPTSRFRARTAFDLALIYAERGEHRRVLALAEDILILPDRREDALWLLAESERALGRTDEALLRYAELAERSPGSARTRDAAFQRALLLRRSDARAAAEALMQFATRHPEDPRAFSSLRAAGSLWVEQGETEWAGRVWNQALAQHPEDPNRVEVKYSLAMMALRKGEAEKARPFFSRILEQDPEGPRSSISAYWLGIIAADEDQEGAEVLLKKALSREQSADHARNLRLRLARLLETRGDSVAAEAEYLVLLAEPGGGGLSDSRLVWLLRRAQRREATEVVSLVADVMVDPRRGAAARESGYYARAEVAREKENTEEAIESWRSGLALGEASDAKNRQTAEAALALAGVLMESGKLEDVEAWLQKAVSWGAAIEDAGLQARGMMRLGDLFARNEAWNEAARRYMGIAVLFEDPELTPAALRKAAEAFERAGRNEEADKVRQELHDRYPEPIDHP